MLSQDFIDELWYGDHPLSLCLAPLGWAFAGITLLRRLGYAAGILPVQQVPVPVIIIGNITVGGTGKTPLIIWLANYLKERGHRPGIISRGYGGSARKWPQQVRADSNPHVVGDEPVLIARHTGCPVAVSPRRYVAARELLEHKACDVLLCDDGLQHLALDRDLEIAVVDGDRRFGNGRCLPAGPLREPVGRLKSVDMVVCNGRPGRNEYAMAYEYGDLHSVADPNRTLSLESLHGQKINAVAGIGNPTRFFSHLRGFDVRLVKHEFPDHHGFTARDMEFDEKLTVVMTEKDAVKCEAFAGEDAWYLPVRAQPAEAFQHRLDVLLEGLFDGQKAA
jgi:tetraacyldisaccharide 4'-kinase